MAFNPDLPGEQVNIYFHLSQAVLDSFTGQELPWPR